MTVAEQLATIRKQKGLSQAKLARETGLSASTIAMYETNRRSPDLDTLQRLARALDVETKALAGPSATSQTATVPEPTVEQSPPGIAARGPEDELSLSSAFEQAVSSLSANHTKSINDTQSVNHTNLASRSNPVNTELTLQVSPEEARILLAMRMSPAISNFLLSYVTATEEERERLERTWQVIRSFQTTT